MFSQMLALPKPRLHAMSYATLMVDLCKVSGSSTLIYAYKLGSASHPER
jgi:hypothetical protein